MDYSRTLPKEPRPDHFQILVPSTAYPLPDTSGLQSETDIHALRKFEQVGLREPNFKPETEFY